MLTPLSYLVRMPELYHVPPSSCPQERHVEGERCKVGEFLSFKSMVPPFEGIVKGDKEKEREIILVCQALV